MQQNVWRLIQSAITCFLLSTEGTRLWGSFGEVGCVCSRGPASLSSCCQALPCCHICSHPWQFCWSPLQKQTGQRWQDVRGSSAKTLELLSAPIGCEVVQVWGYSRKAAKTTCSGRSLEGVGCWLPKPGSWCKGVFFWEIGLLCSFWNNY